MVGGRVSAGLTVAGAATLLSLATVPGVAATPGGWSAPERVSVDDGAQYRAPHAARNRLGEVVAAWVRSAPGGAAGTGRVQIASRAAAGRWAASITAPSLGVGAPHAAINGRGAAAVVWGQAGRVWAAQRGGRAGAWRIGAVARASGSVRDVAVAVNPAGAVMILWVESHGSRFQVRSIRRAATSSRWVASPSSLTVSSRPSVAVAPNHTALAVWLGDDGVVAARGRAGQFEPGRVVAEGRPEAAAIALAEGGTAVGGWNLLLPAGSSVLSVGERPAGSSTWTEPADLGVGQGPVAAINGRGDAVVVWSTQGTDGRAGIEAAHRRGPRGEWLSGTVVPRTACRCSLTATSVAVDSGGAAHIAWRRAPDAGAAVAGLASRAADGASWARTALAPTPSAGATRIVSGAGVGAVALWATDGPAAGVYARATRSPRR